MNKALLENKKDNLLQVIDTIKNIANRQTDLIEKENKFKLLVKQLENTKKLLEEKYKNLAELNCFK